MRFVRELSCIGLLAACSTVAIAEMNDDAKPWSYDPLTIIRATFPEVEPNDVCPGQPVNCGDVVDPAAIDAAGDADFYEFFGTAGTLVTIGTDATGGSATDTYLELFPADCSAARLTFNDDGGPGAFSLISNFALPVTGLYHIKVRHFSSSGVGAYKMFLTCVEPTPPPANDRCEGAFVLEPCSSGTVTGDNTFAINDYGLTSLPCTGFAANGRDVVYSVALGVGDIFDVTYTAVSDGSVYLITDCADPVASCVIGADATLTGQPETFSYVAASAGTYYLVLDSFSAGTGTTWVLTYSILCPPPPVTGACCDVPGATCLILTEADCLGAGGSYQGDNTVCDPDPCVDPTGACCVDYVCTITTRNDCAGEYFGDGSTCDPTPCPPPPPTGACCVDFVCTITTQTECAGQYYGDGTVCDPTPCPPPPPTGACCLPTGECVVTTAGDCQGSYEGDGTVCDPNPCEPPVATERKSWGSVKNQYR
ncbi:MAG: hypothetical protein IPK72_04340 [Candidatus Eisenbacteria bacterium]|nr:hypothetical protein [Candidatus Eisenbacteria bacterium]